MTLLSWGENKYWEDARTIAQHDRTEIILITCNFTPIISNFFVIFDIIFICIFIFLSFFTRFISIFFTFFFNFYFWFSFHPLLFFYYLFPSPFIFYFSSFFSRFDGDRGFPHNLHDLVDCLSHSLGSSNTYYRRSCMASFTALCGFLPSTEMTMR